MYVLRCILELRLMQGISSYLLLRSPWAVDMDHRRFHSCYLSVLRWNLLLPCWSAWVASSHKFLSEVTNRRPEGAVSVILNKSWFSQVTSSQICITYPCSLLKTNMHDSAQWYKNVCLWRSNGGRDAIIILPTSACGVLSTFWVRRFSHRVLPVCWGRSLM